MPGKRKHKYTRRLFEFVDIDISQSFRIIPSGIHPVRSIFSLATIALLLNSGISYFFRHEIPAIISAFGALIFYLTMKQVGVYRFGQEGIYWRQWGIIPVKVAWEEVDKVRKVKVYSPFSKDEVTALRIITESAHWVLNSKITLEQSILLPEDVYRNEDLDHTEIYANHYLNKIRQTSPSRAQLLKIRGTFLWENKNKAFQKKLLTLGLMFFVFLGPFFAALFETRFIMHLISDWKFVDGWLIGLLVALVLSEILGLWVAWRDRFNAFILFAGNEYGSIIFDPNDEITRFRIMAYCLPDEVKLISVAPFKKREDITVQPTNVKEPGKLKAIHPNVIPPGEVTHVVVEIFGDAQNTISLMIEYEIRGKSQEQVLWLVGEREVTGASLE